MTTCTDASGDGMITMTMVCGVALVHAVVDAHQGRITVDGAPGCGAAFTITLPAGHQQ